MTTSTKECCDTIACRCPMIRSERAQNEKSPNYSNFRPEFCSEFSPNSSRIFRAVFLGKQRPQEIHKKSLPFFNAKSLDISKPPYPRNPKTPQQQKTKFRKPRKPRSSPKVNVISPKVNVISPKVNVLSPKVNVLFRHEKGTQTQTFESGYFLFG